MYFTSQEKEFSWSVPDHQKSSAWVTVLYTSVVYQYIN